MPTSSSPPTPPRPIICCPTVSSSSMSTRVSCSALRTRSVTRAPCRSSSLRLSRPTTTCPPGPTSATSQWPRVPSGCYTLTSITLRPLLHVTLAIR
ncbi:MAG: hypothetical protein [Cressdnaviricota sp.]|nr:MAG: hypothetical protein [Cressdnaviricota sp.]